MINKDYYLKALDILGDIRSNNKSIVAARRNEVIAQYPAFAELERKLASTSHSLVMLILKSGDTKQKLQEIEQENRAVQKQIESMLVQLGKPANYLHDIYNCKKCLDTGSDGGKRCACVEEIARNLAVKDLNDSSPISLCSFDSFKLSYYSDKIDQKLGTSPLKVMEVNLDLCKKYAANFHIPDNGLLFTGNTGLGKTHLSLAIATEVINAGYSVVYGSSPDLLRKIEREHFSRDTQEDTLSILENCDLLIFDDLGAEFESQFYTSIFYNLINSRLNRGLPTIVSTNLTVSQLQQRYSDRIVSRLHSMQVLLFIGNDIRLQI